MASILDQYEEESARATSISSVTPIQVPIGPGYIDARTDLDTPIFSKKKINFKPSDPLTHVVVSSNFLVMAMSNNLLLRLDLEHPDQQEEIELPKASEDKVYRLFLDSTGKHLIICMESTENLYLSRNSRKPRSIGKLKGHLVNAVAWNLQNTNENTTGAILLGTSRGLIFETELTDSGDSRFFQGSLDQYLKQLFNLAKDKIVPITGLEFDRMPSDSMTEYKYYILATTPGRLYQFVGNVSKSTDPPLFQQLFMQYESGAEQFLELPGEFGYSELTMYRPRHAKCVKSFAWMTGPGIIQLQPFDEVNTWFYGPDGIILTEGKVRGPGVYHGEIDVSGTAGPQSVTVNTKLIRYPRDGDEKSQNPLSMVMTEFHVLLLFPDRLKVMCVLNEQLIYEDVFPDRFGRLLGLCSDPVKGTIWAFTGQSIFKYKVTREARDVWQMYLDKNEFELAKEYCRDNVAQLDRVLTKQAEYLFEKGEYQESAMMYAQTQNSFEEIALKFIKLDGKDALKSFIQKKLSALRPQDKTQITMLVTWLIEIFLNQLGEMKEQGQDESDEYRKVQEEFRMFLAQPKNKECVSNNRGVVYDLIASHGDVEDMVFFAVLMRDFEKVITHHIQHDNYKGALGQLSKQTDTELVYKFSPLLMQYIPKETVSLWISLRDNLEPIKLIPALVQYDHNKNREQGNEAIKYLEFCIEQLDNKDQAIHNYLLSLYAKLKPDQLMTYLNIQGTDEDTICYDLKYALRLCAEHGHKKACVHIYSLMGLYEEAVDLALQVDVELAKQQADKPDEDDNDLRKKLWLRIARHVVEEEKDVKRAMEFLHDCELLKIEDILPFFPDFVTIDHFKDAIVTSLQEYNHHIEQLKEEMDDATKSAEEIRKEIQSFRNKYAFVSATDKCAACNFPLMARSFYLFPCHHKFHSDCLIGEVLPNLTSKKRQRVEELQRKVAENEDSRASSLGVRGDNSTDKSKDTKAELDDLVASECIYCGDLMVRSIDQPFLDEGDEDLVLSGWL